MKFLALVFVIFAVMTTALSLKDSICGLPHSMEGPVPCRGAFPLFTYKLDTNECIPFLYGGCSGNENQFSTLEECEQKCKE